jgi:hypothetical protein
VNTAPGRYATRTVIWLMPSAMANAATE